MGKLYKLRKAMLKDPKKWGVGWSDSAYLKLSTGEWTPTWSSHKSYGGFIKSVKHSIEFERAFHESRD